MVGAMSRCHVEAAMVVRRAPPPERMAIELHNPVTERLEEFCRRNAAFGLPMVQPQRHAGETLALCGAGPSLREERVRGTSRVWACNSALLYLVGQGARVDAGVGIDQTPGMLREWAEPPDVLYMVATTCDPALIAHLLAHKRRVEFFHNYVGFPDEIAYYNSNAWPPAFMVGSGATVVSRVLGLADWMGFERVDVYGADCAFGPDDLAHANGDDASAAYGRPVIMQGEVNGRTWRTRPDMLMGAVDLARRAQQSMGRVRLIGDTLPVALLGKGDAYLNEVMRRLEPGERPEEAA